MIDIGKKLRTARRQKNFSLRELAAQADVSASLLSQIENNHSNPSVNTLYRIAAALSVPMDYFFPSTESDQADTLDNLTASEPRKARKEQRSKAQGALFDGTELASSSAVMHVSARPTITLQGGVTWFRLTNEAEESIEFLEIEYAVGATSGANLSRHSGREFGLVLEGTLLLELGFNQSELGPGDSIIFESTTPHRLSNAGDVPVRAIWVVMDS